MSQQQGAPMDGAVPRRSTVLTGALPYTLLAILAVVTVAIRWSNGQSPAVELILCALAAGWMWWVFTLHPAWRERPLVMTVFCAVLIVIMAVLVLRAPWFGFFTPAGYLYAFRVLPWPWRQAGVAAVAIVAGTAP